MTRWYFSHAMNLKQFKGALKVFVHDLKKMSEEDRAKISARTTETGDFVLELEEWGTAMEVSTTTTKLTVNNLPKGILWEMDGACWRALRSITNPDEWKWAAWNAKAEAKGQPTGEMFDYFPVVNIKK